ncbi:hypothetical protein BASA81_011085 [Batrachochytrium salamandrivorans]|nr:hypothetical protein BASA81_011085 [Batrachochytrium salamandrivorans]
MFPQLLVAIALTYVASPNEAVNIITQEVYQVSDCNGAAGVAWPALVSGVCVSEDGESSKNTCGYYELWNTTGCVGTPYTAVDYSECMNGDGISYKYKCVDMSAPVMITVSDSDCSDTSGRTMQYVASVGVCTPLPGASSGITMDTSYKLTKTGGEYQLSYYKSSNQCQGAAEQFTAIAAGVCLEDSNLLTWKSVKLEEIDEGPTSAPATTRTASPKASFAAGMVASQVLLALAVVLAI